MNDRTQRAVPHPMVARSSDMGKGCEAAYENPTVVAEQHKTTGLLQRALEVAQTIRTRLQPPPATPDGCGGKPRGDGVLGDAMANRELAGDLCEELDEIARLLG